MANEQVTVSITAAIQGLLDGLGKATGAVKQSTEQMAGFAGGLKNAFSNLMAPLLALTAVVGGGKMFKGAIDDTVSWISEVAKTARVLGISTEKASILGLALDDLGLSSDMYTIAADRMARQIATGGKGFETLGIEIRGADGHLKSSVELMAETLDVIRGMTKGLDQYAAGVAVFGRGWREVAPLLRLSSEHMKKSEERAKRLHLVMSGDSVAMMRAYKMSVNEVNDVWKSFKVQLGTNLMPLLTQFADWMANAGSSAADNFGSVIRGVVSGFLYLKAYVETTTTGLFAFLNTLSDVARGAWNIAVALKNGEGWAGVKRAAGAAAAEVKNDWAAAAENVTDSWARFRSSMKEVWEPTKKPKSSAPEPGTDFVLPEKEEKEKKDPRFQQWKQELEATKLLEANWFTWSEDREKQFWEEKTKLAEAGSETRREVDLEVARASKKIAEDAHQELLAGLRVQLEAYKEDGAMRTAILKAIAAEEARVYGLSSKQAQAANKEIAKDLNEQAKKAAEARKAFVQGFIDPVVKAFSSGIKSMITGTKSFAQAMGDMARDMLAGFADMLLGMAEKWVTQKLLELFIAKTTAVSEVGTAAAVGGAGAAAGAATAFWWNPAIAVGFGAAMSGAIMGSFGGVAAAAEGGFDVPSFSSPVTKLHPEEMVLPKGLANKVRGMTGDGGGVTANFHFHGVVDGQSAVQFFEANRRAIVRTLQGATRDRVGR